MKQVWAVVGAAAALFSASSAATAAPLWADAAGIESVRALRLHAEAGALASDDDTPAPLLRGVASPADRTMRLRKAEARLVEALSLRPNDLTNYFALADVQMMAGRSAAAIETLEQALPYCRPAERAVIWFRLGVVRAKLGRYREAAAAYGAAVAAGVPDSSIYTNLGEVLMADGRLAEAQARYRDAIAVAADQGAAGQFGGAGDRRGRSQDLALAHYGLAVALDREGQTLAAREMMARGLAHDPGEAVLKATSQGGPGSDLFFVPDGDVFYYLGLAAEAQGRTADAEASFREFLTRAPASRWARAAEKHLSPRVSPPDRERERGRGGRGQTARVVAQGTVLAAGPIPAPLVDVAWRDGGAILQPCLDAIRSVGKGPASARFALELEIDGRGRVTAATAKVAEPLDEAFARCAEAAVKDHLRISTPPQTKPTLVRTELIVAFP